MGYNFPDAPTYGQVFLDYSWDGEKWVVLGGIAGPPPVPTDPYLANVKLLMSFNDADNSIWAPGMADESPVARGSAVVYSATIATAQSVFGGSSLRLPGGTSRLNFADSDDWHFSNQPFTVEFRVRADNISSFSFLVAQWGSGLSWVIYLDNATLKVNFSTTGGDNLADLVSSTPIAANTWCAVCLDFNGTKYRLYLNGVMVASSTTVRNLYNSFTLLSIGAADGGAYGFAGYIDELRITKSTARYASDSGYTIATTEFPRPPPVPPATAFLARTSGLDATHVNAYTALIEGLVTDGIWSKLDMLHVYATQDSTTARLNLVSTAYPATLSGSPAFTVDRGYTGVDGPTGNYINTGFNATVPVTAPKHLRDSAHVSAWSVNGSVATSNNAIIGATNVGSNETNIAPSEGGTTTTFRINASSTSGLGFANTAKAGYFLANRSSSSAVQGYINGSQVLNNASNTSGPLININFTTLSSNLVSYGNYGSPYQCGAASIGGSLNSTEATAFYNRLRTYMTAVGVP